MWQFGKADQQRASQETQRTKAETERQLAQDLFQDMITSFPQASMAVFMREVEGRMLSVVSAALTDQNVTES